MGPLFLGFAVNTLPTGSAFLVDFPALASFVDVHDWDAIQLDDTKLRRVLQRACPRVLLQYHATHYSRRIWLLFLDLLICLNLW